MGVAARAKEEWERASIPYPLPRRSGKREVIDEFRRYGDAIALLEWPGRCNILKVEPVLPRTGAASRLVDFLRGLADTHGITLFGNAVVYSPSRTEMKAYALSQEQLEAWYERHGFRLHRGTYAVELWYPSPPNAA